MIFAANLVHGSIFIFLLPPRFTYIHVPFRESFTVITGEKAKGTSINTPRNTPGFKSDHFRGLLQGWGLQGVLGNAMVWVQSSMKFCRNVTKWKIPYGIIYYLGFFFVDFQQLSFPI